MDEFYNYLVEHLIPEQVISLPNRNGNIYFFSRWLQNGNLQFNMGNGNIKSIPPDIINLAKSNFDANDNFRVNGPWLSNNNYRQGGCTKNVLNYLLLTYPV